MFIPIPQISGTTEPTDIEHIQHVPFHYRALNPNKEDTRDIFRFLEFLNESQNLQIRKRRSHSQTSLYQEKKGDLRNSYAVLYSYMVTVSFDF